MATLAAASVVSAAPAHAATRAGTSIVNTATMAFGGPSDRVSIRSNTVALTAAELLDVTVTADRGTIAAGVALVPVGFVVSSTGNGEEAYALTIAGDRAGVSVARVAIDSDDNGSYDPATDQLLATGTPIVLAPGRKLRVFVLVDGMQVTGDTRISLAATARTGSGAPGTTFAGAGENGGDAVVGQTGATASALSLLTPAAGQPSLTKSQSVFAPDGSTRAVRGAIVTYSLVAGFPGATRGVVIDDPLPAGTDYVPGSIALDGRPLSDAVDADAGSADAAGIHVAIGDVAAASNRTIQFSVKIQ